MLSTIFYRISSVAAVLGKNVEEAFRPKMPVISSKEPVFTTALPTSEATFSKCETFPTSVSEMNCKDGVCTLVDPILLRQNSIINIEENGAECNKDCANCECKTQDVEDCGGKKTIENADPVSIPRVCSKSSCACITNCDISGNVSYVCDLSGNCCISE